MVARAYRVITHIHSHGSNALASGSYDLISGFIQSEYGAAADRVQWSECETSASDLEAILDGRRTRRPVEQVFLTDHMSPRCHQLEPSMLALACRRPRFAVGAEIRTCLPNDSGGWLIAPEVLVYGAAEPHDGPGGQYYGLTQDHLDAAFDTCMPPGAPLPDLLRLLDFLQQSWLACALAHPLDGHQLPIRRLLAVLELFDFIETVNGGYSQANARLLSRMLDALRQRQRASEGPVAGIAPPPGGSLRRRAALVALGGSDAHLNHFDRVVTLFSHDGPPPDAGAFIEAMLAAPDDPMRARARFAPSGRGILASRLYWEVLTLIARNVRKNTHLLEDWRRVIAVLGRGMAIANRELRTKSREAGNVRQHLSAWLEAMDQARGEARSPAGRSFTSLDDMRPRQADAATGATSAAAEGPG